MGSAEAVAQIRQRVVDLGVLVDKLQKLYPEAGKPALFGFSQGAVVSLQAALEIGDRFSAVAALSGYLASEDGATRSAVPVLVTGGTKDGIIPQERSWAAALVLEHHGHTIERLPFVGPHGVPPVVIDTLRGFLVAHLPHRDEAPTRAEPTTGGDTRP
jgi:phospholipase/carboxylesterase